MSALVIGGAERLEMGEVWDAARRIGRVSLETEYRGTYQARINFEVGSSSVYSYGKSDTPTGALIAAIEEARRLGAAVR